MNELKEKFMSLGRAIAEERKGKLRSDSTVTDDLLRDCLNLLARSYMHFHDVEVERMSDKERDMLLVAHAKYSHMIRGGLDWTSDEIMCYLDGHMNGQRKMLDIMNELSLALRQFKGAHPCTDDGGATCPTHRSAETALERFESWKRTELLQPST